MISVMLIIGATKVGIGGVRNTLAAVGSECKTQAG